MFTFLSKFKHGNDSVCRGLEKKCSKMYAMQHDSFNKQLLDEVEHDIMNYQNRGLCYLPKPKAEADNTDTRV